VCSGSLEGGGSERQIWQLVSHLDRQRFAPEVYLLARRGPYLEALPSDVPVHAFDDEHPHPSRFPPGRISWLQVGHLRRIVRERSIDVVYDRTFHMSLLTSVACRIRPPRVSVIVSPPSRDLPATERRYVRFKRWLLARAYRSAAATICVSEEVAEDAAIFYGLQRSQLCVMPNPIDIAQVRVRSEEPLEPGMHRDALAAGSELHAAVIGRFTAEKGQQFAIEVAAEFARRRAPETSAQPLQSGPLLHLHLVGSGPLESQLRELVHRLKLEHCVHFYGYLTNPYPVLRSCDVALVPSRYEGFPNIALEALALGVPLLMTDYGPTARQIIGSDGERGQLIPVGDHRAAAAALLERWRQPEPWLARARAGQEWVEREHSLAHWLESMMGLLERVRQ
jgi:glycosyltransferase involved in cell wall biosynthesis